MKYIHAHGRPYRIIKALRHSGVDKPILIESPVIPSYDCLLQENGSYILQENGYKIKL